MHRLATPWCFIGPSGAGKACTARRWIEEAYGTKLVYPLEHRTFSVGDGYEARVLVSPYHFEIDIPNLSMQDKQIIGDLLTMFLSSVDVMNSLHASSRKLVILRRAHCLSLPAAIRVRAILQQYVFPASASGMIWLTTREMTGSLALLEDGFVRMPIPRVSLTNWGSVVPAAYNTPLAWDQLEGRPERATAIAHFFPTGTSVWPRRIQDFYDELVAEMMRNRYCSDPNLDTVLWIRARVYDALSFCQTGPEIVDSCAAALVRHFDATPAEPAILWEVMEILAQSEPHTSYRTPLALECAMLNMYDVMRRKTITEVNDADRLGSASASKTPLTIFAKSAATTITSTVATITDTDTDTATATVATITDTATATVTTTITDTSTVATKTKTKTKTPAVKGSRAKPKSNSGK